MPKRSAETRRPCDAVAGAWPDGPLADDAAARYVQLISREVAKHLKECSLRAFSRAAGVSVMTVIAVRDGARYPDVRTLALLERAVGHSLLPDWKIRRDARGSPALSPACGPCSLPARGESTEPAGPVEA